METRPTTWVDIHGPSERYGIKVNHPTKGWVNAGDDKGMFAFDTTKERDAKRAYLRNIEMPAGTKHI